ncbi:MAG: redoxin domain-containing protein [Planctomycetota bacterium]|nr:redoxin domain-containing protein [Planctomycetota bacterium]
MRGEQAALKAQADGAVKQSQMQASAEQRSDLEAMQALLRRQEQLAAQVAALEAKLAQQPKPSETTPPPAADPELQAKLQRRIEELGRQTQKLQEQLEASQLQAERAKTAAQIPAQPGPGVSNLPQALVGKPFPMAKFVDSEGKLADLSSYAGKKSIVLVFMKGYYSGGVCIYCTQQTTELAKSVEKFHAAGAEVFVVFPGPERYIQTFVDSVKNFQKLDDPRFRLPFQVLLDADVAAAKLLGISGDLAHPTTYLIDRQGVVRYQKVGRTIHDRPKVEEMLKELEQAAQAP